MAYNLNNMARIAQVGQKLKFRDMPTLDFSGAIDDYFNARDAADKRAQEQQRQQDLGAWTEAINNGDTETANRLYAKINPEGFMQRQQQLEDMARKEQFERNLAAIKHGYAMQTAAANAAGGTGSKYEFQSLLRETESPEFEQKPEVYKKLVRARLNYLSNAPENIFEKSYQGQRGKDVAAQEAANMQNAIENQQQYGKVDNAIALVESLPDDMFKPYAAASGYVGALTGGNVGMSAQDQQAYGELERTIGSLQNDLLQKARSKGQTGINTMSEIRQATKGLQYDRGKARLLGALKQLQSIEYKLDAMPTMMSVMPQGGIPSDADAFGDI